MSLRLGLDPAPRYSVWLLIFVWLASVLHGARAADDFLEPELAFTLAARPLDGHTVELRFTAAPGYYLYRDQFKFSADGARLGEPVLPQGKVKFDETFQKKVETYRGDVRIVVPVEQAPARFTLMATHQGCADTGLCYPPMQRGIQLALADFGGDGGARVLTAAQTADAGSRSAARDVPRQAATSNDATGLDATLRAGRFWSVVGVFFVAGLLLSLTPCMLPMLPILSSIIVGQGVAASRARGLALAAAYSFGMALVYTALGIAAGLAGEGLAAALQNAWVLGGFASLLVLLALSMFGAYELRLPVELASRLTQASQRFPAGRLAGVFAMGGVSALIVSPCVAAPLAGALVYLSQTRDVGLGGTALFSLAAGMSMPLLLVGASAGALLPRAGAWMEEVKRFFGLLLLGVALWTVQSVLAPALALALWGALTVSAALLVLSDGGRDGGRPRPRVWRRGLAAVLGFCGLLQFVGAAAGGSNPLQPLAPWAARAGARNGSLAAERSAPELAFRPVRNGVELDAVLRAARRPVMLDFYADWCVSCKEMERFTFMQPAVRAKLAGAVLLRADVTANTSEDRALLKRFDLFGPPGTLFFDNEGRELRAARVIGFLDGERFLQSLRTAGL